MRPLLATALGLAAAVAAGAAQAQSLDDKLRQQLRTVTQQLRDTQNQLAALQAQKSAPAPTATAAPRQCPAVRRVVVSAPPRDGGEVVALRGQNAQLQQQLAAAQADVEKYRRGYTDVVASSERVTAERNTTAQSYQAVSTQIAACEEKNVKLIKLGRQVLDLYSSAGVWEALRKGEPITGLKRVQLERMAQEYGDRVYEQFYDRRKVKIAAAPAAAPAAAEPVAKVGSDIPPGALPGGQTPRGATPPGAAPSNLTAPQEHRP